MARPRTGERAARAKPRATQPTKSRHPSKGDTKSVAPRLLITAEYDYETPDGAVWFQKIRKEWQPCPPEGKRPKEFRYRWREQPTHVWINTKRPCADELIYNLPEVLAAVERGVDIRWAEGEKDADALIDAGETATTHHQGAGRITLQQAQWFRGHRGLVILHMDMDEVVDGCSPGILDVMTRYDLLREVGLSTSQLQIVVPAVGKDVFDHLAAGHGLDEFSAFPRSDIPKLRRAALRTRTSTVGRQWMSSDWLHASDINPSRWKVERS